MFFLGKMLWYRCWSSRTLFNGERELSSTSGWRLWGEVRLPFKSFFPGCILFRIHSISRTKLKTLILGARMLKSIPFPVGVSQKSDKGNSIIAIPARLVLFSIEPLHLFWEPLKSPPNSGGKHDFPQRRCLKNPRHSRGDASGAKHHGVEPIVLHPSRSIGWDSHWFPMIGVWWMVGEWLVNGWWMVGEWLGMV